MVLAYLLLASIGHGPRDSGQSRAWGHRGAVGAGECSAVKDALYRQTGECVRTLGTEEEGPQVARAQGRGVAPGFASTVRAQSIRPAETYREISSPSSVRRRRHPWLSQWRRSRQARQWERRLHEDLECAKPQCVACLSHTTPEASIAAADFADREEQVLAVRA